MFYFMDQSHGHWWKLETTKLKLLKCGFEGGWREWNGGKTEKWSGLRKGEGSRLQIILKRKGNWLGYVLRGYNLITMILEGTIEPRKRKGRRKIQMVEILKCKDTIKIWRTRHETGPYFLQRYTYRDETGARDLPYGRKPYFGQIYLYYYLKINTHVSICIFPSLNGILTMNTLLKIEVTRETTYFVL